MSRRSWLVASVAVLLATLPVGAQQQPQQPQTSDGGAVRQGATAGGDAAGAGPVAVDPHGGAPHGGAPHGGGHPHGGAGGAGGGRNFRNVPIPPEVVVDDPAVPPGSVWVGVVDVHGNTVPEALVRLGSFREGARQVPHEMRTGADGIARFDRLAMGLHVSYRASAEYRGARSGSPPFVLGPAVGTRVQLVRFDVESDPARVPNLLGEARFEIGFQDDRIVVVHRITLGNFSYVSSADETPRPVAWVPRDGLRFRLPEGYSVFNTDQQMMGDQRVVEDHGYAVMHGSVPPTRRGEPIQVVFQYRIKFDRPEIEIDVPLPPQTIDATVITHAPPGMRIEVEGIGAAQADVHNGQHIWVARADETERLRIEAAQLESGHRTGRIGDGEFERRRVALVAEFNQMLAQREALRTRTQLRIRLTGIPMPHGPERNVAAIGAVLLALSGVAFGLVRARGSRGGSAATRRQDTAALKAERDRILAAAAELARARESRGVGPETYAQRRRELAHALARVLQQLGEIAAGGAARQATA